jgi:hypothetical protein
VFELCLPVFAAQADYASRIASMIDPAKLATLGPRGANQRVQKSVYWLATARQAGQKPAPRQLRSAFSPIQVLSTLIF